MANVIGGGQTVVIHGDGPPESVPNSDRLIYVDDSNGAAYFVIIQEGSSQGTWFPFSPLLVFNYVSSFNGQSGDVFPQTNDYAFNQISGNLGFGQIPNGGDATTYLRGDGSWAIPNLLLTGMATIVSNSSSQEVDFVSSYNTCPVVVLTPLSDPTATGGYWIDYIMGDEVTTGFTINVSNVAVSNVSFNYVVLGNPN